MLEVRLCWVSLKGLEPPAGVRHKENEVLGNMIKKSWLDFVDHIPKDPLNDGDGYLNCIKAYIMRTTFLFGDPLSKLAH